MINYIKGDLLYAYERAICHCVNIQGKFASGVAGVIAKKYPGVRKVYLDRFQAGNWALGDIQTVYVCLDDDPENPKGLYVVNMASQDKYGYDGKVYLDYDATRECFTKLFEFCQRNKINPVAIPFFGVGLAGGSWDKVSKIIEETQGDITVNVYYINDSDYQKHVGSSCLEEKSSSFPQKKPFTSNL